MAKKKTKKVDEVKTNPEAKAEPTPEEKRGPYNTGTWSICPRCKTQDSVAVRTAGEVVVDGKKHIKQYRKCRRLICRHNFAVLKPA